MPQSELPSSVKFHYIKSNSFRVVHVDGSLGGITPSREIFVSLYSERGALPKMIEWSVSADGSLGEEISREGKDGIVREMDVGLVMTPEIAESLAEFLQYQVKLLKESVQESPENTPPAQKTL
jgi:hypothetical protein